MMRLCCSTVVVPAGVERSRKRRIIEAKSGIGAPNRRSHPLRPHIIRCPIRELEFGRAVNKGVHVVSPSKKETRPRRRRTPSTSSRQPSRNSPRPDHRVFNRRTRRHGQFPTTKEAPIDAVRSGRLFTPSARDALARPGSANAQLGPNYDTAPAHAIGRQRRPSRARSWSASFGPSLPAS
jgi:hypothetical protein